MTLRLCLPALFLAVGACQPAPTDPLYLGPPDQAGLESCGGQVALALIGQDVSALPAAGEWGALRVIRPGMAVTEDYSTSRLNVLLDDSGHIQWAYCG